MNSNLVGKTSTISIILDGDVRTEAQNYITKHGIYNNIPVNYLPIESLEKFLKTNLVDRVDHKFFRTLNDYVFHQKSLNQIIDEYKTQSNPVIDLNGKKLYKRIDTELRERGKTRADIIEMTVDYLLTNKTTMTDEIVNFLKTKLE